MTLNVDPAKVAQHLEELAAFSETPAPAITRVVFSQEDLAARTWFKGLCKEAGLEVRQDPVGNTVARWIGQDPELPAVATGSHIDAIPNSGRFDGTVGVLGGLEAISALRRSGFAPRRSIELILFTSEEPTRFGIGCLGSRLLSGSLTAQAAAGLRDGDGQPLSAVLAAAGFTGPLEAVALAAGTYHAFVELHIEQGPVLEREGIAIGIVTDIAAPATLRATFTGEGGHAGAMLMPERRDAFLGAAELALAVEAAALGTGAIDSVATTGICQLFPGAVNSVPSQARLEIDVRDTVLVRRDGMIRSILSSAEAIASKRKLTCQTEVLNADAPASCDPSILQAAAEACQITGNSSKQMVSRAYHDSLFMARIAATGMIFIPCRNGVSHRPDEYAATEDIGNGVAVLAHTLASLAR